jgi:hypothetical protein
MPVETLGEALAYGWRVHARCAYGKHDGMKSIRACVYSAERDLDTLVWTRGRSFPLSWLQDRLRCPRCGSRRVVVVFEPPTIRHALSRRTQMAKKTSRGRNQDRARIAGGQDYEVAYEANKTGKSRAAVKRATKKAGPSRKKVERTLGR